MGGIDIELLIKELLAVKASNEDLTRRVEALEQKLADMSSGPRDLYTKGWLR